MKIWLTTFSMLLCALATAQKKEQFYDWNWKPTEAATARYLALIEKQDTLWHRQDYFLHEKRLQMDGFYIDEATETSHGLFRFFHPNGQLASTGHYIDGKRQGKWQFFHKNGQPSAVEMYAEDKLLSKNYFDESGGAISDTTSKDKEADFPGGLKAWQTYLLKQLYFPPQYKISNADKAVVVVSWVVNEDGTVSDVAVTTPLHPSFDKIAAEAIHKSPKWQPAISHTGP